MVICVRRRVMWLNLTLELLIKFCLHIEVDALNWENHIFVVAGSLQKRSKDPHKHGGLLGWRVL